MKRMIEEIGKVLGFLCFVLAFFLFFDFGEIAKNNEEVFERVVYASQIAGENDVSVQKEPTTALESNLMVHFMDVGQGDATLFVCDGEAMLLDTGDTLSGTKIQLYLKQNGIEKLKYLILTHPDEDHIGGADVIITKYDIENIFMPCFEKETKAYEELIGAVEYRWYSFSTPMVGSTYSLGNAVFTIISPNRIYADVNNSSMGILLAHGNNKFLFTGDAEIEAENDIVNCGLNLDCNVYKAGHHGSKTSNSIALLNAVTPEYVVVSCEENNSYGHPHAEPMNYFRSLGLKVFRTDEQGTIIAASDGTSLVWNMASTESWKAGEPIGTEETITTAETRVTEMPMAGYSFAVNGKNGKIHIVGACTATGNGKQAMKQPVYFNTYEEAEVYSIQYHAGQKKRQCGNCW